MQFIQHLTQHLTQHIRQAGRITTIVLLFVSVLDYSSSAWAQDFSSTGQPRAGTGGASRGGCPNTLKPLTALAPIAAGNGGKTTQAYPTVWVYLPYKLMPEQSIVFKVQNEQGQEVYRTQMAGMDLSPGVISLTLPSTASPLELGQSYHWHFLVYCNKPTDRPTLVSGWIQRVDVDAALQTQLATATPQQQSELYASHLIWYDALTVLGQELRQHPQNADIMTKWVRLLALPTVGLDQFSQEPLTRSLSPQ